jgi:hypothetical protein
VSGFFFPFESILNNSFSATDLGYATWLPDTFSPPEVIAPSRLSAYFALVTVPVYDCALTEKAWVTASLDHVCIVSFEHLSTNHFASGSPAWTRTRSQDGRRLIGIYLQSQEHRYLRVKCHFKIIYHLYGA